MTTKKTALVLCSTALMLLFLPAFGTAQDFKVIVNDANPATTIDANSLSRIFLKKTANWPHGLAAVPIDQRASSEVRQAFSMAVHNRGTDAIRAHWQRMVFSGRAVPPLEQADDGEVLNAVRASSGAVGYVSASTPVGNGVKVLKVTGN